MLKDELRDHDEEPMPLLGWLLIGSITVVLVLVLGSFMSLVFYWFRGWITLILHYVQPGWRPYSNDIAWSLGFLTGVLMALFGKNRWRRVSPAQRLRERRARDRREKEIPPAKPITSIDGVVTRGGWGLLAGLVLGLFTALILEVMFISASLSPLGPPSWKKAMTVKMRRETVSSGKSETQMVFRSSHPLFKYLFLVPAGSLPLLGAVTGCVSGVRSWRRAPRSG